jgi:uncharacterized protein Yka (UPF0111/DUF47 family)
MSDDLEITYLIDHLEHIAGNITHAYHHHQTQGAAMTLDEIRTDLQNVVTKLDQHVVSPIADAAGNYDLPAEAEAFIADVVKTLAAKYGTAKPAAA